MEPQQALAAGYWQLQPGQVLASAGGQRLARRRPVEVVVLEQRPPEMVPTEAGSRVALWPRERTEEAESELRVQQEQAPQARLSPN